MPGTDPRRLVEAPIRRELWRIVARGVALVGATAALAASPAVFHPGVETRDEIAMAAPVLLLGYVLLVHVAWRLRGRARPPAGSDLWARAKDVDRDDAFLGRMIAAWVPVGLLLALGVLVWPHITDRNPALAVAWVVFGLPPMFVAWVAACDAWRDAVREDLARAIAESDARLRGYWAGVRISG